MEIVPVQVLCLLTIHQTWGSQTFTVLLITWRPCESADC